jgi:hypothetical protein
VIAIPYILTLLLSLGFSFPGVFGSSQGEGLVLRKRIYSFTWTQVLIAGSAGFIQSVGGVGNVEVQVGPSTLVPHIDHNNFEQYAIILGLIAAITICILVLLCVLKCIIRG